MGMKLISKIQSIFYATRLRELNKIKGHIGLNEGFLLFKIAKSLREDSVIVEIGSFKGKSTCFIAEGMGSKKIQFFCIDPWKDGLMQEKGEEIFSEFSQNTKKYRDRFSVLRGFSHEVIKQWPSHRKIDFLWIDGGHSYEDVQRDIHNWTPLVKKNSFICFHDYRDAPGVKKAVDELTTSGKIKFIKTEGCVYVSKLR